MQVELLYVVVIGLVFLVAMKNKAFFAVTCFDPRTWQRPSFEEARTLILVVVVGLGIALYTLPAIETFLWQEVGPVATEEHQQIQLVETSPFLLLAFVTLVVPLEEWLCRKGFLELIRNRFEDKGYGVPLALFGSAAIFGGLHLVGPGTTPLGMVIPFLSGIILGVAYLISGLAASIAIHLLFNLAIFFIYWL